MYASFLRICAPCIWIYFLCRLISTFYNEVKNDWAEYIPPSHFIVMIYLLLKVTQIHQDTGKSLLLFLNEHVQFLRAHIPWAKV
jgi:hypothetical protein